MIQYASGDGDDTVIGFNSGDTLHITKGSYQTLKSGENFIVKVGSGKIVLKNALSNKTNSISIKNSSGNVLTYNNWKVWKGSITGNIKSNVTLAGSKNNDTIGNSADNVLITGQAGKDSIYNDYSTSNVTINGGAGNDLIDNRSSNVTIDGGAGNDYISNGDEAGYSLNFSNVSINGGAGNDTVYIDGGGDETDISPNINNVTVNGDAGNDLIKLGGFESSGRGFSINGGAGNDTISNETYDYNPTITGGKGADLILLNIWAENNNVIQYAEGDGNDTIYGLNTADTLQITSGEYTTDTVGSDLIVKVGENSVLIKDAFANVSNKINIQDSSGEVKVYNDLKVFHGSIENNIYSDVTLAGSDEDDTIGNSADNVLITGQAGDDSIKNYGENIIIDGGTGNDSIENWYDGSNVTITGGEGNDSIKNLGENVSITGGDGDDLIYNDYNISNVTIDGGAGNDEIDNSGSNVTVTGDAGNDSISNSGDSVTITGGVGKDLISLSSYARNNVIQYASGDGNDTVYGFNSDDTLHITKGSYETLKSGKNFIVKVGNEKIVLKNALADKTNSISIKDSSGNIVTYNDWEVWNGSIERNIKSNVTLAGSDEADTIGNLADNVLITGQAGKDSIISEGENVTITGGAGNDSIESYGENLTINGGTGNDSIGNSGNYATISGGAGDDKISLSSYARNNVIQYASGDGNDTIYGFNSDDILQITKGDYTAKASGNDVIFTVGKGKIILKDAVGEEISILTTKKYSNVSELFAGDDLSEIIAEKSVSEFENLSTFSPKTSSLNITYAE